MSTRTGVHDPPESAFMINRIRRSQSNGIDVHNQPERAEFGIAVVFETVKHQRADEDFAAGISCTILLCQPCLEGFGASLKLGYLLFNGFASHGFSSVLS